MSGRGGVGTVLDAGIGEDAEAGEGAAINHGFFHVVVDLVAMGAGTIGGRYHGRVLLPDRHRDAIVAHGVGRKDLIGETARLGAHPGVGCVDAVKVDDAIEALSGAFGGDGPEVGFGQEFSGWEDQCETRQVEREKYPRGRVAKAKWCADLAASFRGMRDAGGDVVMEVQRRIRVGQ